jgi:hypothetical protein
MNNIDENTINLIKNIYFDPSQGLSNAQDIYEKLNK